MRAFFIALIVKQAAGYYYEWANSSSARLPLRNYHHRTERYVHNYVVPTEMIGPGHPFDPYRGYRRAPYTPYSDHYLRYP